MDSANSGASRRTNFSSFTGKCTNQSVNTARLARDCKSRAVESATLKDANLKEKQKANEPTEQNKAEKNKCNDLEKQLEALKAQLSVQNTGYPAPSGSTMVGTVPYPKDTDGDISAEAQGQIYYA